ncbi:MAG: glycosyltransferase family A protein [Acidobacteriota bacterium]
MNKPIKNTPAEPVAKPAFSVVMPLWNKEATVARAIRSVLAQTAQDWELIVVDDGSTDGSAAEVGRFDDPRIRMVHQVNAGVSAARNRGIQEARAEWVAFLDADDEWLPGFLETVRALRSRWPEAKVAATSYWLAAPSGARWRARVNGLPDSWREGLLEDYFAVAAVSDPPLWTSAVAVERRALLDSEGFPVGVASGEDLLTWARLAARYSVAYCTEPLAVFYAPLALGDRPGRRPAEPDRVGEGLASLEETLPSERRGSLRRYVARWHAMRAILYLEMGSLAKARAKFAMAREYHPLPRRERLLWAAAHVPGPMVPWLVRTVRRARAMDKAARSARGEAT